MDLREEDIKKFQDFIDLNIKLYGNKASSRRLAEKSLIYILELLDSETRDIPLFGTYISERVTRSLPGYFDYARKRLEEDYSP